MWSVQYDCWKKKKKKKKNRLVREHLVVIVKPKKVLLTYTLFHNKIHNFFCSVTLTLSLTFKKSTRNNCY